MDFSLYKNTVPYPSKDSYTMVYWYKGGHCIDSYLKNDPNRASKASIVKALGAVSSEELDTEAYQSAKNLYNDMEGKLCLQFQNDLFETLGIADNPKRFKLWELAWEHGHANGFSEVYSFADDLVCLNKD